jgi:hypothetical protein
MDLAQCFNAVRGPGPQLERTSLGTGNSRAVVNEAPTMAGHFLGLGATQALPRALRAEEHGLQPRFPM